MSQSQTAADPNRPAMFSCARQVSVIQVGTEGLEVKSSPHQNPTIGTYRQNPPAKRPSKSPQKQTISKDVLQNISDGLTFTNEVVREMAPYTIPYSEESIYDAYDTSEFLSKAETKMKIPGGRFNMKGSDRRHMSCHFKKLVPYRLKPIKRAIMKRALEMQKKAAESEQAKAIEGPTGDPLRPTLSPTISTQSDTGDSGVFLTQAPDTNRPLAPIKETVQSQSPELKDTQKQSKPDGPKEEKHQWDEYLLSILTGPTAQWLVTQKTDQSSDRYKDLHKFMLDKHGSPTNTELVRDSIAEYEPRKPVVHAKVPESRPNTRQSRLLEPAHRVIEPIRSDSSMDDEEEVDTVPYADKNQASFYRQPGGIKKQMKARQKEMGALNSTATSIVVNSLQLPPPPKLRDFVDPRITENTVYETNNNFQRDWLTGNRQVHQNFGNEDEIVMENHNKYTKILQDSYPRKSDEWCSSDLRADVKVHKVNKGLHRWKDLPKPVQDASQMMAGVVEDLEKQVGEATTDKFQPSEALSKIVDEWRSKWHLNMRFDDANPDDLIRDMEDIHPHVRIKAISTAARAACYKAPPQIGIQLTTVDPTEKANLPEKIFVALDCLLGDEHAKVSLAASITLHALSRPNERAKQILRVNLQPEMNKADRWAAVQCLGFFGETDSQVIGECVAQMLNTEDMIKYEKACALLALISHNTADDLEIHDSLVHSMIAEHLNDVSWRHRVMALKCLPKLYGEVNIDIQNKLVYLMWNDSHSDVRRTAAQTLGKCGYGRLVHDKMREKLHDGTQSERTETLAKIGYLGIMTAKLMIPFMASFRDEYVSVRREACIAAGNLRIKDENLIVELIRLSTRDPIWRIKALAIQALGKIGLSTPEIKEVLLWALRFEEEEGVRAEACHSIVLLQLKDREVLDILQNRMLVEESAVVQQELIVAMELNGVSATEDMAMVAQIKAEVRKLSNRNDIYSSICVLEKQIEIAENTERMIYIPPKPKTPKSISKLEALEEDPDRSFPRPSTIVETQAELDALVEQVESINQPEATMLERPGTERCHLTGSRLPSAKSRPISADQSSLNTEVMEDELAKVLTLEPTGDDDESEIADDADNAGKVSVLPPKSVMTTPSPISRKTKTPPTCSRNSTGLGKRLASACSNRTSVTPTALSTTIDQTDIFHTHRISALERERRQLLKQEATPQPPAEFGETVSMDQLSFGSKNNKNLESLAVVEATRQQNTEFLFERYTHIDVQTPDTMSAPGSVTH